MRLTEKGEKEKGDPGDVQGEMQQDSGRAQVYGRKKREQAAVLMCQEDGACNTAAFMQVQQNQ